MAPFDSGFVTKISPLIEGQVPDFIQNDHPQFVEFLKQYYQFLEAAELTVDGIINNVIQETTSVNYIWGEDETRIVLEVGVGTTGKFIEGEIITGETSFATATVLVDDLSNDTPRMFISSQQKFEIGETITGTSSGATAKVNTYRANPVQTIQQLLDYANTDNTTALMLDEMQRQFMSVIPNTLADGLSKRNLIKNIKDLYASKGTSEGHKLFLRLMFAEEADIFYPTKYMLRTSDGNWDKPSIIRCEISKGSSGTEVIGQVLTGRTSGATVFVVDTLTLIQGSSSVAEFKVDVDSLVGTFVEGETLYANGVTSDVEHRFTIQKIVTGIDVVDPGILYNVGDTITLDSSVGNGLAIAKINTITTGGVASVFIDAGGSNYREGDALVFGASGGVVPAVGFVSVIGGALLSEDSDDSDGLGDYITLETYTTFSYPEINFLTEDGYNLVLNGTDSSSTDANSRLVDGNINQSIRVSDRIGGSKIIEELATNSIEGEVAGIELVSSGSGYSTLPPITVTSQYGTGIVLISTTNDIGSILDTEILDSGFLYRTAPEATVPINLILKDVLGEFDSTNILSSHEGTVTAYNDDTHVLSTTLVEDVYVKMEQVDSIISQNIEQEENTEVSFSRILGDNVLESNSLINLIDRGFGGIEDAIGLEIVPSLGILDQLVLDAEDIITEQITLEQESDYSLDNVKMQLEDQHITGEDSDIVNFLHDHARLFIVHDFTIPENVPRHLHVLEMNTYHFDGMILQLEGTAIGGSILLDGTDGSGTDAGDELLEETDGDKIIQQPDDEGAGILYEPHSTVSNTNQSKDKFVLDGTKVQNFTDGGWLDEDRIDDENLRNTVTNSQVVWFPSSEGDDIALENENGSLLLNGTTGNWISIHGKQSLLESKLAGVAQNAIGLDNGFKIKTEGDKAYYINVPIDNTRSLDETEGVLLEDGASDRTENVKEFLLLESIDGITIGSDANGFYDTFENKTINHGGDSSSRLVAENGEGFIYEHTFSSPIAPIGAGDRLILNSHIITSNEENIRLVFNQTDANGADAGDAIKSDGLSIEDRSGNLLMAESGISAGLQDSDVGGNLVYEPESFLTGNIILDRTNEDDSDIGGNLLNEIKAISLTGQTLQTINGSSAKVISSNSAVLKSKIGFLTTKVGDYKNTDSLISEDVVRIQDSYYYQDFSYEVKIGQSASKYINELKRAVHPSGFAVFGKVTIASLISAVMPTSSGGGRIDVPATTFSSVLSSVLETIFNLRIPVRLNLPKVYQEGNLFQKLMLESGAAAQFNISLDGTNYGTASESPGFDAIASEDSEDVGDNIIITGSDDGSQVDAGDQIILEGTNADGLNNVDVTGEAAYIILNGSSVSDGVLNDEGSYCVLSGSALGVYNLVDNDNNSLVLNGTDGSGEYYRIIHEDGNEAGSIITDYLIDDGKVTNGGQKIISENTNGDNIILNGTDILGADTNSKLVSEAAAGVGDNDRDRLFLRHLKLKLIAPKPKVLTSYGLPLMGGVVGRKDSSITNIQLEDGLRKRGPTINTDNLILDGVDVGEKGDVNDIKYIGDPVQMETSIATMLGTSITFDDYARTTNYSLLLNGTDGSSTNTGDYIYLEKSTGGIIISEDEIVSFPINEFLRPDIMVMEGAFNKHSEYGKFVLDGTESDNSIGALNDGSNIILDGIDAMQSSAGDVLILEEINDRYKTYTDDNDIGILMESHHIEGGFILREYGGGAVSEGDMIVLDGTDSSSLNADDKFIQEDTPDVRISQNAGNFVLENNDIVYMTLDASDTNTDVGVVIGLEDESGAILNETKDASGQDIILETGSTSTLGSKLVLDYQVIEIESGINDGEIPSANFGNNSVFPTYTQPTVISTRVTGKVSLQDESPYVAQSQEGDTGDILILDGTATVGAIAIDGTNGSSADENSVLILEGTDSTLDNAGGQILHEDAQVIDNGDFLLISAEILDQASGGLMILNGTDGSSTNENSSIQFESGTYFSLLGSAIAFLPRGSEAESFDNTLRTTFDSTIQTYDVLEGV